MQGSLVNGLVAAAVGSAMGEPIEVMAAVAGDVALLGAPEPAHAGAAGPEAKDPPAEPVTRPPGPLVLSESAARKAFEESTSEAAEAPADGLAGKSVLTDADIEALLTTGDLGTPTVHRATWPAADAGGGAMGGARGLVRPDTPNQPTTEGTAARPAAEPDQSVSDPCPPSQNAGRLKG
jgi:hypothetical protein